MIIIEALLLTILLFTCVYATFTDIKHGIIENRILARAVILGLILNLLYYIVYAQNLMVSFLVNIAITSLISILFYAYHIWAAGDTKLIFVVIFLIPMRLYGMSGVAPAIWIIISVFSIAYIYVICESVYLSVKEHRTIKIRNLKINVIAFLGQYITCGAYILLFNQLCGMLFREFTETNASLMAFADLIIVLSICSIDLFRKKWLFAIVLLIDVILCFMNNFAIMFVDARALLLIALIIILRFVADRYNYKIIKTEGIKRGMVLSYATVISFSKSRVVGLPKTTTEDIRSRINDDEVNSILRWKNSKYGSDTITIVRKIPFAIFISIGTILFIILRMCA